jgi:hypothetical protein
VKCPSLEAQFKHLMSYEQMTATIHRLEHHQAMPMDLGFQRNEQQHLPFQMPEWSFGTSFEHQFRKIRQ